MQSNGTPANGTPANRTLESSPTLAEATPMTTPAHDLDRLFEADPNLASHRAAAELRAGRPIVIGSAGGVVIIAALDGVSPSVFAAFSDFEGGILAVSAERARAVGLTVDGPIALSLAGLSRDAALEMAIGPGAAAPVASSPSDPATAAAIDLCKYALLLPSVLAAPVRADMALPAGIHRVALASLMAASLPTRWDLEIISDAAVPLKGNIQTRFLVFRGGPTPRDQVAVVVGTPDPAAPVPVRIHSSCLTGDLFGSLRCDCGDQLQNAVARLAAAGGGVLIYLDQEGRGIGIGNKMRAYALQDSGYDTVDADAVLGFSGDERRFEYAAAILAKLGFERIILLTNNPLKLAAMARAGIEVVERQPLTGAVTAQNLHYLHTKARKADHMLGELLGLAERATGE